MAFRHFGVYIVASKIVDGHKLDLLLCGLT